MVYMKYLLHKVNLKVTVPRLTVLKLLMNSTCELTVTEIVRLASNLSFGTVYSALGHFEKAGLVRKFKIGNERARYSLKKEKQNFIRWYCNQCNCIRTMQQQEVQHQVATVLNQFSVDSYDLILYRNDCDICRTTFKS